MIWADGRNGLLTILTVMGRALLEVKALSCAMSDSQRGLASFVRTRAHFCLWTMALLCALLAASPSVSLAQAASLDGVTIYELAQQDINGDGSPDRVTMLCSFASEADRVEVYDGSGDMVVSSNWQHATDLDDDTWLFDVGADGSVNLIIVFSTDGDQHIASLYDDRDGDGRVSHTIRDRRVTVQESSFWTARVIADGAWWKTDGSLNRNLLISVDGPVGTLGLDYGYVLAQLGNDGIVDLEMETRTGSGPDLAGYSLARSFAPLGGGIPRTIMRVNVRGSILPEVKGYVFWPHLGPSRYLLTPHWEMAPALRMDWAASRLDSQKGINDIMQRIPPEKGWRVYASRPTVKGKDNLLNFENPFAFYDLAADEDGWPELIIRHAYFPPGTVWYSIHGILKQSQDPRDVEQLVRYTWDQDNDDLWEYKLGLIGRNEVETVVAFPDFGLVTIPYDRLPWTLTEAMRWDAATFVQVEGQKEASPEGVYEWDDIPALSRTFIFGVGDDLEPGMDDIRANFRGEYRVASFEDARLYCSPVDRKLHLFGAEAGVWNLDDVHRARYADLDSDGYIDQWTFTRHYAEMDEGDRPAEEVLRSLRVVGGFLLYADAERAKLVYSPMECSLFEVLPPRDHAEWLALGEQLGRYARDIAPGDFLSMMVPFQGPTTEVEGATVEQFQLTEEGFRFVLDLQADRRVLADDNGLALDNRAHGSYVITYDDAFGVLPLAPPRIYMPPGGISCDPSSPQELEWLTIEAVLQNDGLSDVGPLLVQLYAAREGNDPVLLADRSIQVPGQGSYVLTQKWPPPDAGRWTLWVEAGPADVELGAMARLEVDVEPAPLPDMFRPMEPYDGVRFTWPVALLGTSIALAAVCTLGLVMRRMGNAAMSER